MDINKIDKYLSGEMKADEQAAFEKEMQHDPSLSKEVTGLRLLTASIEDAILEERISEALTDLPKPKKQNRFFWWLGAMLLVGVIIIGVVLYPSNPTQSPPDDQPMPSSRLAQDSLGAENTSPPQPPVQKEERVPQGPIASNEPSDVAKPLPYPAPKLRGSAQKADTLRQAILNSVWHTPYPPDNLNINSRFEPVHALLQNRDFSKSYARLQLIERQTPENDTLFFLKGYCLLESGQGNAALRYFDQIQDKQPFGEDLLKWYRGLSLLLMGEDEEAKRTFLELAENAGHPFGPYAANAAEKLK